MCVHGRRDEHRRCERERESERIIVFIEIDSLAQNANAKFNISIEIGIANKQTHKKNNRAINCALCHSFCAVVYAEQLLWLLLLFLLKPITILQNGNVTAVACMYDVNIANRLNITEIVRDNKKSAQFTLLVSGSGSICEQKTCSKGLKFL